MNLLFFIIFALLLEYILERVAGILNIKNQRQSAPTDFGEGYDGEKHQESQEYLKVNTNFTHLTASVNLLFLICMIGFGAFNAFSQPGMLKP